MPSRTSPATPAQPRERCGVKRREAGSSQMNSSAATMPSRPSVPSAARQPKWSDTRPVITRPDRPPKALPLMYNPMTKPSVSGSTSSAR